MEPTRSLNPEEAFVRRLKEVRARTPGMSRARLAEKANQHLDSEQEISEHAVVRIEQGERRVNLNEALAICAALDVAPAHMFFPLTRLPGTRLGRDVRVHMIANFRMREWLAGERMLSLDPGTEGWQRFWLNEVPEPLRTERRKQLKSSIAQQSKEEEL